MKLRSAASFVIALTSVVALGGCYRSHTLPQGRSDVDGDGRDDIISLTRDFPSRVFVAKANPQGNGFIPRPPEEWNPSFRNHEPVVGDFDGDGRHDIAGVTESEGIWVSLSDGHRFVTATSWSTETGIIDDFEVPQVGDFDGDGKDDLLHSSLGSLAPVFLVNLSSGGGFDRTRSWGRVPVEHSGPSGFCALRVGNVDGDADDDIVAFCRGSTSGDFEHQPVYVYESNGVDGFGPGVRWHGSFHYRTTGSTEFFLNPILDTGDFNGDGKDDIIAFTRGRAGDVFVALSDGRGFGIRMTWSTGFATGPEAADTSGAAVPGVGDFNGDGRDDVVSFTRGTTPIVRTAYSNGINGFSPTGAGGIAHAYFAPGIDWPLPTTATLHNGE